MDSFEINETLKARKRRLVVPIISNELNCNVIENNDMK